MSGRPYPTPNRLKVLREIEAGELRHYHFIRAQTVNKVTDRLRTAIVDEFVAAGLADRGEPDDFNRSIVALTTDGRQYLDTYGKNGATT